MVAGLRLPEHSHCKFCGDPIPFGEEYCDEECRSGEAKRERDEKRKEYRFWGSAVIVCAIVVTVGVIMKLM